MTISAADVFVSYKAEDRARVKPLVEALEAEGFTVWWDAHIGAGTNWREDIQEHLDAARCVIVVWSRISVGRDGSFVRDEAARAQRRNAYVPIRIDEVEPPLGFGEIQAISLKGWKGNRSDTRFQAVVHALRSQISGKHAARAHGHFQHAHVSRRTAIAGGAGVAALAAAGGGWFLLKPSPVISKRIAVLPFANLSGAQDQAYFAEGIAEELRGALSRIGLQVIGRASSEAVKDLDTQAAAAKLGVANLLTGSVRRSPTTVRISAQLVGGSDGVEHWAQSYDRAPGDEIKIQTDIATNVAQALSVALGQAAQAAIRLGGTSDAAAQDLFLRARTLIITPSSEESYHQANEILDAAIARDPNFADAWRLKARAFERMVSKGNVDRVATLAQAETAARRAIALAPKLGGAYVALAFIQADRFDFSSALENMKRGLALSPEDLDVVSTASEFAHWFGNPAKALELADLQVMLDPLDALGHTARGEVLRYLLRRYPEAISENRRALELAPQYFAMHVAIGDCLALMNRPAEARAEYAKAPADDALRLAGEAILAARIPDLSAVERIVAHMRRVAGTFASYQYGQIYSQLGDANRAFAELDNAFRLKDPGLQVLTSDPFLDPIRRDPRYATLVKRLNFPTWT